jgi:PncC family amidohydrolase
MDELRPLAEQVAARLRARDETVAVVESSAGGLISASLLSLPGASAFFLGGAVVYTRQAREALLDIPLSAMQGIRSASEPYALLLARTARSRFGASWTVAETGAAGPTGNRYGDAAGHSCFVVAGAVEAATTLETGSADREANMRRFTAEALRFLLKHLD